MFRLSILIFLVQLVISWDLSSYDVNKNYYVSSIAVYRSRAFLTLPRSVCHNNRSGPTLVETRWIGDFLHSASNPLLGRQQLQDHQKWNDCGDIQDAISSDVEKKRHKLWILDKGNELCQPKIVSFNLFYNIISEMSELTNIPAKYLNVFKIDSEVGKHGHSAFIGRSGDSEILVFSLSKLIWWKLKLLEPHYPMKIIKADFLAISKTSPQLFLTSNKDEDLFVLDLEMLRNSGELLDPKANEVVSPSNVTLIGKKLGLSSGLETDFKSGLSYFMTRDYAIVRWVIGSPLEAEFHNVLAQSYVNLPYVSQLFTDPQEGIWALVNKFSPEECSSNLTSNDAEPALENRIIRILRYNKLKHSIDNEV